MGGLKVDEHARVHNKTSFINGLYAAGEVNIYNEGHGRGAWKK
jgi:succinate dehydrogenase/fumarate reductase flavoprotein subunit